ncbi:hypothetical protein JOL62DRAFT_614070 [Phyllosticta paracitricarpa]|uniref:ribonuclease H n=1 Tax=Phyllosticta paracitricarpa TaxID=2016321 RepID=A0ABR1N0L7_9PEZI
MSASAKDRRLQLSSEFYSELEKSGHKNLIRECPGCRRFLLDYGGVIFKDPLLCHDWAVIFTDGACPGNGSEFARAGIGIAAGEEEFRQLSVPWNSIDAVLKSVRRTNQQAELFAGMAGLKKGSDVHVQHLKSESDCPAPKRLILATDSKYVVDCLTVLFPGLQKKGAINFSLISRFHEKVVEVEKFYDIEVFFLHIPRTANCIADKLARDAAQKDDITVEASAMYQLMAQLSIAPPAARALEAELSKTQVDEIHHMKQAIDGAMASLARPLFNCNTSLETSIKEALYSARKALGESYELQDGVSAEKVVCQTLLRAAELYTDDTNVEPSLDRRTVAEKFCLSSFSNETAKAQDQAISRAAKIVIAPLHRANAVVRKIVEKAILAAMDERWNGVPAETEGVRFLIQK